MRIAIDASRAASAIRTGTENYSRQIIASLARIDQEDSYTLYYNSGDLSQLALNSNFRPKQIPMSRLWTHVRLSAAVTKDRPDILFVPAHVLPAFCPVRSVVTIHDLGYYYYPAAHTRARYAYLHASTWFSSRYANRIIAISEATKHDLMKIYGVPERKISVIHHGYDPSYHPVDDVEVSRVINRLGLANPYFLHIGTMQPRKNIVRLINAFEKLKEEGYPHQLALIGKRGWLYDSISSAIQASHYKDDICELGYVDDADLPAVISGAEALTIPSLYEGFGLPALEAMACGTPVIASNTSSLPEVVDNAGILVDPLSEEAIAHAMIRVAAGGELRQDLSRRGLERARQFSWERCARETLTVIADGSQIE